MTDEKVVKAVGSLKGGVMEFRQRGEKVTREPIPPMSSEELEKLEERIIELRQHYSSHFVSSKGAYMRAGGMSEAFNQVLGMLRGQNV